ncbi:epoxyalkane--coenzyme M transferase [Nocardia sp. NPDC059246]|uniref:epoxyalkane--coenzyme M transferase n=1 Tax=unclassified Nocardia TaxID=2637762 RepID=UPI0036CB149C
MTDVVRQQAASGIDIVNDGEFGKPVLGEIDYAAFTRYRYERLSGYTMVEIDERELAASGRDRRDYADFYAAGEAAMSPNGKQIVARCVGPITYTGASKIQRDISNLEQAVRDARAHVSGAFLSAIAPHDPDSPGEYYATAEEEGDALAAALREEYRAITGAGISIQIDDARLAATFESKFSLDWDLKGFRKWAGRHIELINFALEGIPPELVRYHLCWGSWKGPHSSDIPLAEVVDLLLRVNASQYVVEAANPQHEHEWAVWREVTLPEGKKLVPGVVTHKTNVVEHVEVVAQRLTRYAEAVGRDNIIAGTDCGMGGRIHPQLAWGKLRALSEGAHLASTRLWS